MLNFTSAPKILKENIGVYNIFLLNLKKKKPLIINKRKNIIILNIKVKARKTIEKCWKDSFYIWWNKCNKATEFQIKEVQIKVFLEDIWKISKSL